MGERRVSRGRRPWLPWYGLGILVLLYLVSMVDRTIVAMLIGPIKADLALGDFEASLLMGTAFGVCYVVFSLPFGWAADRFPKHRIIALGIFFWSLACAAGGLASGFGGLFLSRMMVGVGEAALSPCAYSMMASWFPRARLSLAMAIYHFGGSIGGSLAFVIGGLIVQAGAEHAGGLPLLWFENLRPWQYGFLLVGLPGIPLALLALTLPSPRSGGQLIEASEAQATPHLSLGDFVGANRRLVTAHFAAFALTLVVVYAQSFWMPQVFVRDLGWSPMATGSLIGALTLCSTLAGQVGGVALIGWLDRRGHADAALRAFGFALALAAVASVLAFSSAQALPVILGFCVLGACLNPVMTYGASALQIFTPAPLRGRMSALYLSVTSLVGLGAGPAIVGYVAQYGFAQTGAVRHALLCVSLLAVGGALVLLLTALAPYRRAAAAHTGTQARPTPSGSAASAGRALPT